MHGRRRRTIAAACLVTLTATPIAAQAPQSLPAPPAEPPLLAIEPPPYDPDNDPLRPPREPAQPIVRLRILMIDLRRALSEPERVSTPSTETGFRHTFGSRRYTPPEQQTTTFDPSSVDADLVFMPEVASLRLAARLFPPRAWRIVRARSGAPGKGYNVAQLDGGGPAIAVRLQRGVRIAGLESPLASPAIATARLIVGTKSYAIGICGPPQASSQPDTQATPAASHGAQPACAKLEAWARSEAVQAAHATGGVIIAGALPGTTVEARVSAPSGPPLVIDTSGSTAVPIANASKLAPRVTSATISVVGKQGECRSDDTPPDRIQIAPGATAPMPYRMLAWQITLNSGPSEPVRTNSGIIGESQPFPRPAKAGSNTEAPSNNHSLPATATLPPWCALAAQIAP